MTPAAPTVAATPEAHEIDGALPGRALVLEASAGTGKTYALTALAVRLVAETDLELRDILLVTFTRMATAELRDRVRRRLAEVLRCAERVLADPASWAAQGTDGPADPLLECVIGRVADDRAALALRRDRLRKAAQQLDDATIATIHGFCQRMLQHAALEAGVDFDAALLDDDAELREEIVDDWIALELRGADPDWIRYLQDAGVDRRRLQKLSRAVAELPSLRLRPHTEGDGDRPTEAWQRAVERFAEAWQGGGREEVIEAVAALHADGAFGRGWLYARKQLERRAAEVDDWLAEPPRVPPAEVTRDNHNADPPLTYFTRPPMTAKLQDAAPPDHPVLDRAEDVLDACLAPATAFLARSARYFWDQLDRRKQQRTLLTYNDLLRRLADALDDAATGAAVRAAVGDRYRAALIDEFQDTDPVQWRIFSAVFGRDRPFVLIGDPKQAIYGFRGADVRTYVHARDTTGDLRTLRANHRSDRGHVEAINRLFAGEGVFAEAGIDYLPIEPRKPDRLRFPDGPQPALRIRFVRDEAGRLHRGCLTKGWADRNLPADVTAVVLDLLERDGRIDGDEGSRPLRPQDIAVLVRTNRRALLVQQALRASDVPAVIQRGGSVYATEEAEWLQRLLDALARPSDDRRAATAAASRIFGRDALTLAAQRDAVDRPGQGGQSPVDGAGVGAWDAWLERLHVWGAKWQHEGVMAALREAFADDGVPERLLGQQGGDRSLTNLRHLAELLHTAEASGRLGPSALVAWLRERRAEAAEGAEPDADSELRLEEDAAAVRIVTVHASKGLQYPVVLCPDLWDGAARVDTQHTRYHDPAAVSPSEAITLNIDADDRTPGKEASIALAERAQRAEHLRLAYVALTRAEHACVLWWGRFTDAATSPLASLLHGGADDSGSAGGADRLARAQERVASAAVDVLEADIEALAADSGGTIAVEALSSLAVPGRLRRDDGPPPGLSALPFERGDVDRTWQRTSFTRLVAPAGHYQAAAADGRAASALDPREGRDTDDQVARPPAAAVDGRPGPDDQPDVPLATLPAGAGPGVFLHDVLERVDFDADGPALADVLAELERRHGIDPAHRPAAAAGLRAALRTPLGPVAGGARLCDLSRADRLDELRFELPLAGGAHSRGDPVTLGAVADLLAGSSDQLIAAYAERLRDPALGRRFRGYLTGAIDLTARLPDGRFLVADYKSNRLGDRETGRCTPWHYRPEALAEEMLGHHYVLQALLYLVAVHRYLRWRLGGAYRYDTHVAGAAYLFLRGMTGPPADGADGSDGAGGADGADGAGGAVTGGEGAPGVVALRPEGTLITALSALLNRPGSAS